MNDEQRQRLPQYAQRYITTLEMKLAETQEALEAAHAGVPEDAYPRVDLHPWRAGPTERRQDLYRVAFVFGPRWHDSIDVRLDRHDPDHRIEVSGSTQLAVEPSATNVLRIQMVRP